MINKYAEIRDRLVLYNACKGILRTKVGFDINNIDSGSLGNVVNKTPTYISDLPSEQLNPKSRFMGPTRKPKLLGDMRSSELSTLNQPGRFMGSPRKPKLLGDMSPSELALLNQPTTVIR